MDQLSSVERELVALGAALGSNCLPCIESHVPAAREAGLTDQQIREAIRLADAVRRAPARKSLEAALRLASAPDQAPQGEPDQSCCG